MHCGIKIIIMWSLEKLLVELVSSEYQQLVPGMQHG